MKEIPKTIIKNQLSQEAFDKLMGKVAKNRGVIGSRLKDKNAG